MLPKRDHLDRNSDYISGYCGSGAAVSWGAMGEEYLIEWLAPPRSEPLVLGRGTLTAASLETAVAYARIELAILRRHDDAVEGFRLLSDGKIVLSRWLQPDGGLSEIPLPPKAVSVPPVERLDEAPDIDDSDVSKQAA